MDWKLEVVPVPVTDIDRAKAFYSGLGFAADLDIPAGGGRIVQLTPPGSGCSIHLNSSLDSPAPGSLRGLMLIVDDIKSAHDLLVERGAEPSPVQHYDDGGALADGPGGRWNSFVFFNDPDGNSWVLQERPAES